MRLPRIESVLLPILREGLPGVMVSTWAPDVDHRNYPLVNVRRAGDQDPDPELFGLATVELSAWTTEDLPTTEELYLDARWAIWQAVRKQTLTPAGFLHSYREILGPIPVDTQFDLTWRTIGILKLGFRPLRSYTTIEESV